MHPSAIARRGAGIAACVLLTACLSACRQEALSTPQPESQAAATAAATNNPKETSPVDANVKAQSEQPPAPDAVMYFIYDKDGDGATSYELDDGLRVSYWYGHQFDFQGKHYFSGFAYSTEPTGDDGNEPGPESKVTLASASFALSKPGTAKPWSFVGSEQFNGEFGSFGNPESADEKREAIGHDAGDRYLLAVPVQSLQSGSALSGYVVLRFIPGELEDVEDHHWLYLGTLWTGEDNAAACDGGEVMPCISNSGSLAFEKGSGAMPDIVVSMQGTTIESPGKTRELGPQDRTVYRYDAEKEAYVSE